MPLFPPPPQPDVARELSSLRARYAAKRLIEIACLALALDVGFDAANVVLFALTGQGLYFPPFFFVVFAVLLLREIPGLRLGRFASHVDGRFGLKDRLYSHVFYRQNPGVPDSIRSAQSAECLASVPFAGLRRAVRPGFPRALCFALPVFALLAWVDIRWGYRPAGIVTRSLLRTIPGRGGPSGASDPRMGGGEEETTAVAGGPGAGEEPATGPHGAGQPEVERAPGAEIAGNEALRAPLEVPGDGERGAVVAESREGLDRAIEGDLQSTPTSGDLSRPEEPALESVSTFEDEWFGKGGRVVSLLPAVREGPGSEVADDLEVVSVDLTRYPVKYREQLGRYYERLRRLAEGAHGTPGVPR